MTTSGLIPSLFPSPSSNMAQGLRDAHSISAKGKPANVLSVLHLDGCFFCEITLGTLMYESAQSDSVQNSANIKAFQLLMDYEGQPIANHTYCQRSQTCSEQLLSVMGIAAANVTSFPTEF